MLQVDNLSGYIRTAGVQTDIPEPEIRLRDSACVEQTLKPWTAEQIIMEPKTAEWGSARYGRTQSRPRFTR